MKWFEDEEYLNLTETERYEMFLRAKRLTIHMSDHECPLCGSNFIDNGLFVCQHCGSLKPIEEQSPYDSELCYHCDPACMNEIIYESEVNFKIDKNNDK